MPAPIASNERVPDQTAPEIFRETIRSPRVVEITKLVRESDAAPTNTAPRRMLDLNSIVSPELKSLTPTGAEIAAPGDRRETRDARAAALGQYAARIREAYRDNRDGLRDGFRALSESLARGDRIAITCACRGGDFCHADVIRLAIKKVHEASLVRQTERAADRTERAQQPDMSLAESPRTQRAINEILAITDHDRLLANLGQTAGRNGAEHASYLGQRSPFARDLYERGGQVLNGHLIVPAETQTATRAPAVTTLDFAVRRLTRLTGGDEEKSRQLAPVVVRHAQMIAGASADGETKIKVFEWIYDALEGRTELLQRGPEKSTHEPLSEAVRTNNNRFDETLREIESLAHEMAALEPSDRITLTTLADERLPAEGISEELDLARLYRDAIEPPDAEKAFDAFAIDSGTSATAFERIELAVTGVPQVPAHWHKDETERVFERLLPKLDRALEDGTPIREILRPFDEAIRESALDDARRRLTGVTPNRADKSVTTSVVTDRQIVVETPDQVYEAYRLSTDLFFRNRRIAITDLNQRLETSNDEQARKDLRRELRNLRGASPPEEFRLTGSDVVVVGKPSATLTAERKFFDEYLRFQLSHPDVRLRHANERYRDYARRLELVSTRAELLATAASIRRENAAAAQSSAERSTLAPALSATELRHLFTESSPAHYSAGMTALRLTFAQSVPERRAHTDALLRGELKPGPEASRLIESLTERLNRRTATASLAATRHFLESLRTPSANLRTANRFDHQKAYAALPPAERDFVYQQATRQLTTLSATLSATLSTTVSNTRPAEPNHSR